MEAATNIVAPDSPSTQNELPDEASPAAAADDLASAAAPVRMEGGGDDSSSTPPITKDDADKEAATNNSFASDVDQLHHQQKRKVKRAERVRSPIVAPSASVMDAFCAIVFDSSDRSLSVEGHEVSFRWKLCVEM